jgi:AcrR family transcriptional regulator
MGTLERRERERDLVRTKILDAARELFAQHGYEGVSMRRIAEKIEYSPTVIYQHFEDKEALIKELCYADFAALAEELQATLHIPDSIERLRTCGEEYVHFAIANPNHYRLMFMTPHPVTGDEEERQENQGKPESDAYALVRLLVQMAADDGRLRDAHADVDLVAQTLWAGLHGVIALHIVFDCDAWTPWRPLADRTRAMLDTLSGGLFLEKP